LIVELDGGIHTLEAVKPRNVERDAWFRGRGYAVIRITNEKALFDPVGAVERIVAQLGANTPTPPRKGSGL
jgi:very-short-patch-repair endonuclease